jgi:hypothetical protein
VTNTLAFFKVAKRKNKFYRIGTRSEETVLVVWQECHLVVAFLFGHVPTLVLLEPYSTNLYVGSQLAKFFSSSNNKIFLEKYLQGNLAPF